MPVMKKGQFTLEGGRQSFAISLSSEMRQAIKELAREQEESESSIIRKAVKAYLKAQKPE
jgi:predicted transcriptional regulator